MPKMSVYYSTVYYLTLIMVMFAVPALVASTFFLYEPKTAYQLQSESHALYGLGFLALSYLISQLLYAFRGENAPRKWNQWLVVILISLGVFVPAYYVITWSSIYVRVMIDDIPVQKVGTINRIDPLQEGYFGLLDEARYGQIPRDAFGKPNRYRIRFYIDSDPKPLYTAFYFYQSDYVKTLKEFQETMNEKIVITYLPHSRNIVRVDKKTSLELVPLYRNDYFSPGKPKSE